MSSTGGKLDVLVCAVYIDCGDTGVEADEAEGGGCRCGVGAEMDPVLIDGK